MLKPFLRDSKSNIWLNDSIRYQKSYILVPDETQYPLVTPAAPVAGQRTGSPVATFEAPASSLCEVDRFIGRHGDTDNADVKNRLTTEITDTFYRRRLMNRDILVDHVFGQRLVPPEVVVTMLAPFKTCEGLVLEPQQTLAIQNYNYSTAGSSSFKMHLEARATQTPAWQREDIKDFIAESKLRKPFVYPFWLTTDRPVSIPAGGTAVAFMTVTRDIRFVGFCRMQRALTTGVAGDLVNKFTVTVRDAQTQRPMNNQPVSGTVFGGNANVPYWMPTGWMIEPNSVVQLDFENLVTDAATEVFLTWHGVACFVG